MLCAKCGKSMSKAAKFCGGCGNKIEVSSPSSNSSIGGLPKPKNNTIIAGVVGFLVVLAVGIGGYFLWTSEQAEGIGGNMAGYEQGIGGNMAGYEQGIGGVHEQTLLTEYESALMAFREFLTGTHSIEVNEWGTIRLANLHLGTIIHGELIDFDNDGIPEMLLIYDDLPFIVSYTGQMAQIANRDARRGMMEAYGIFIATGSEGHSFLRLNWGTGGIFYYTVRNGQWTNVLSLTANLDTGELRINGNPASSSEFTNAPQTHLGITDTRLLGEPLISGHVLLSEIDARLADSAAATHTPVPLVAPSPQPPLTAPNIGDIIPFGGYVWRVLDIQDGRALLLSEHVIGERAYHNIEENITWEHSTIRHYLNNQFLNSFNAADRARIAETRVINNTNPWYGTPGGNDTVDRIFLLSIDEIVYYFGDSGDLNNRIGWDWNGGPVLRDGSGYLINDRYNFARTARTTGGTAAWWWLRSPGSHQGDRVRAAYITTAGYIYVFGFRIHMENGGVRPALWLNL